MAIRDYRLFDSPNEEECQYEEKYRTGRYKVEWADEEGYGSGNVMLTPPLASEREYRWLQNRDPDLARQHTYVGYEPVGDRVWQVLIACLMFLFALALGQDIHSRYGW
jgi:hypothetical protein